MTALDEELPCDPLTINRLSRLLGDCGWDENTGPNCVRLSEEARAGRLTTVQPILAQVEALGPVASYSIERASLNGLEVTRANFKSWLDAHGTDDDRASPAATWANH